MTESYITFDTAKLAKEKGIHLTDEMNCDGLFFVGRNDIYLPSQAVFARWLREKHGLFIEVMTDFMILSIENEPTRYYPSFSHKIVNLKDSSSTKVSKNYSSYEEALEYGLQEALKLLNN